VKLNIYIYTYIYIYIFELYGFRKPRKNQHCTDIPAKQAGELLTDLLSDNGVLLCESFLKDCTAANAVTVDAETAEGEMGPELSLIQVRVDGNILALRAFEFGIEYPDSYCQ
jgi:hypothetical protein